MCHAATNAAHAPVETADDVTATVTALVTVRFCCIVGWNDLCLKWVGVDSGEGWRTGMYFCDDRVLLVEEGRHKVPCDCLYEHRFIA